MIDHASPASFAYRLQQAPAGFILLDATRAVIAANELAAGLLSRRDAHWLGANILELHPPSIRPKVAMLLDLAEKEPATPAGMVLNLPEGTMVARVTRLQASESMVASTSPAFAMMFFASEETLKTAPSSPALPPRLLKLPLAATQGGVVLVDVADVAYLKAEGHYSHAVHANGHGQCPLPLAELARRLPPETFLKVHRSYLVNLGHVRAIERQDDQWRLVMALDDATRVPVARRSIDLLRHHLAL